MDKGSKQQVLKILEKEPQGLTIQEITRIGKINRFNATMFVHELLGEGKIMERKIGAYRLFKVKSK